MIESQAESATRAWSVPQCPFTIDYSLRALDDIRLAVMDAFFSLPRGGAEIGGVLLGKHSADRVTVLDYLPLECEHAFGPSFNLSPPDEGRLTELLAQARGGQLEPVGWYHSHTRSEIFLSDADQSIHRRFFPEPWQVALVLKPHTFQPMRCGFFFSKPDGGMDAAATLEEFTLEPQPMRTMPAGEPPPRHPVSDGKVGRHPVNGSAGDVIDISPVKDVSPEREESLGAGAQAARALDTPEQPVPETAPPAAASTTATAAETETVEAARPEVPAPAFAHIEHGTGGWWKTVVAVTAGVAIGATAYQTRKLWVPHTVSFLEGSVESPAPADIGLSATDTAGQLLIHWDAHSRLVQEARGATLTISDGMALPKEIRLDRPHVLGGAFTYGRQGEEVDVVLNLDEPDGRQAKDITGFIGKLPPAAPVPAPLPKGAGTAALEAENDRLRSSLATESERVRRLQKALIDAQKELQQQARKRLGAQAPDK